MRSLFIFIFLNLFIFTNSIAEVIKIKNPILSATVAANFINYIKGNLGQWNNHQINKPISFWVTADGKESFIWYTQEAVHIPRDIRKEKIVCEQNLKQICKQIANNRVLIFQDDKNEIQKIKFSSRQTFDDISKILKNTYLFEEYSNNLISFNNYSKSSSYVNERIDG